MTYYSSKLGHYTPTPRKTTTVEKPTKTVEEILKIQEAGRARAQSMARASSQASSAGGSRYTAPKSQAPINPTASGIPQPKVADDLMTNLDAQPSTFNQVVYDEEQRLKEGKKNMLPLIIGAGALLFFLTTRKKGA